MNENKKYEIKLIAWELTKKCRLNCIHCRANAELKDYQNELSAEQCFKVIDNIASFASPIMILTGGEAMERDDIYEIASYSTAKGLRIVLATCGEYINKESVKKLIDSGIKRISLSLDGAEENSHDKFRNVKGSFKTVLNAAKIAKENNLEFQINTTVSKLNYKELDKILDIAVNIGAVSFHPFLLITTGRGEKLKDYELSAVEYENILNWIYKKTLESKINIKPTCAPHYYRIYREEEKKAGRKVEPKTHGMNAMTKGCLGGQGFAFISNTGKMQICGFLNIEAGDLKKQNYDFKKIWENSSLFKEIRDIDNYNGKCGYCVYRFVCSGCRARAYYINNDYLGEEPFCIYTPVKESHDD